MEENDVSVIVVGRICLKTFGREIGERCVIVDVIDKSYVLVTGPKAVNGVKRRRANVKHLEPTVEAIKIKQGASDEEVISALKGSGKIDDMKAKTKKKV
jgi:large subunit ribosomal protein L14e